MDEPRVPRRVRVGSRLAGFYFETLALLQRPMREMEPPVLLYSTRRSGSTAVSEAIGVNRNFSIVDEPFNLWRYHPHRDLIPSPGAGGKLIGLSAAEQDELALYVKRLATGELRRPSVWNPLRRQFRLRFSRIVVKILHAKSTIDWLPKRLGCPSIFLLRHPVAVASSILRLGWGSVISCWLSDKWFCDRYLTPGAVEECERIRRVGSDLEIAVLEWGLENIHPFTVVEQEKKGGAKLLLYENLAVDPRETVALLAETCELSDTEAMLQSLAGPSSNASRYARHALSAWGLQEVATRWWDTVDPMERRLVMTTLLSVFPAFGRVYTWESPWPIGSHASARS